MRDVRTVGGQACRPGARLSNRLAAALAVLMVGAACLCGGKPALADHDEDIFCEVHHSYFDPPHFRRHLDGYVVFGPAGYHFYPLPLYGSLVSHYHGRPAVYVSGGYFYPLWVGYGPVYEPTGYLEIFGGRFGRTHLGLRIGIGALPTIGYGFLAYPSTITYYHPHPRWYYYRPGAGPPHIHNRAPHGQGHRYAPRHRDRWEHDDEDDD